MFGPPPSATPSMRSESLEFALRDIHDNILLAQRFTEGPHIRGRQGIPPSFLRYVDAELDTLKSG